MPEATAAFRQSSRSSLTRPVVIDTARANKVAASTLSPTQHTGKKLTTPKAATPKSPTRYTPSLTSSTESAHGTKGAPPVKVIHTSSSTKDPPRTKSSDVKRNF